MSIRVGITHNDMTPAMTEIYDILFNDDRCRQYLLEKNVFQQSMQCPGCGADMERSIPRWTFRCRAKMCRREVSLSKNTFFEGNRLKAGFSNTDERGHASRVFLA
jgi:hypothetical protein